jgi:CRISPR/Cas system-associated exonuclease Cas4 (RecB family)
MTKETKQNRYEFDKAKHRHTLDGVSLTGCTTVLSVIAKPALIQWAANQAIEYVVANATTRGVDTTIVRNEVLDKAKTAHRIKKEKAGDWGTEVHAWIENFIMSRILQTDTPKPLTDELKAQACNHFVKWADDNKVVFKESEKNVYSEKMWIGGIVDIVCEIDGKVWIADIKTGSGIYPEHFWQMAAYDMCLEEMGLYPSMTGHIVLNCKKDGTFDEKRSVSNEENKKAFLAALTIYRVQEKIKNQVIQK